MCRLAHRGFSFISLQLVRNFFFARTSDKSAWIVDLVARSAPGGRAPGMARRPSRAQTFLGSGRPASPCALATLVLPWTSSCQLMNVGRRAPSIYMLRRSLTNGHPCPFVTFEHPCSSQIAIHGSPLLCIPALVAFVPKGIPFGHTSLYFKLPGCHRSCASRNCVLRCSASPHPCGSLHPRYSYIHVHQIQTFDTKVSRVFSMGEHVLAPHMATNGCQFPAVSFGILLPSARFCAKLGLVVANISWGLNGYASLQTHSGCA